MENQILSGSIENFGEMFDISTAVDSQETKQIYTNGSFNDFSFNLPEGIQLSDSSITQFPMDNGSCSSIAVPSSDQVQFNCYYPALIVVPIQSLQNSTAQDEPSNHLQQNSQYFFFPQQFNGQSSDFIYPSTPQYLHLFDSSINQSPDASRSSFNQLNSTMIEISNSHNYSTIDENKQERKKRQNRAAAQRAREKERNLLNNLIDEYESLKKDHERKVEEIKKLNSILDRLKEEKK